YGPAGRRNETNFDAGGSPGFTLITMNRLLEPETSTPERRRGPSFWQDEEKQSVIVGLILTFILWWPSLLLFGWALNHIHGKYDGKFKVTAPVRQFNIQL